MTEPEVVEGLVCDTSVSEFNSRQSPHIKVAIALYFYLSIHIQAEVEYFIQLFRVTQLVCLVCSVLPDLTLL